MANRNHFEFTYQSDGKICATRRSIEWRVAAGPVRFRGAAPGPLGRAHDAREEVHAVGECQDAADAEEELGKGERGHLMHGLTSLPRWAPIGAHLACRRKLRALPGRTRAPVRPGRPRGPCRLREGRCVPPGSAPLSLPVKHAPGKDGVNLGRPGIKMS